MNVVFFPLFLSASVIVPWTVAQTVQPFVIPYTVTIDNSVCTTACSTTLGSGICGATGTDADWYCASMSPLGQSTPTAVAPDSCFCVLTKNITLQDAYSYCASAQGFLTDIQNPAELALINAMLAADVKPPAAAPPPSTASTCGSNAVQNGSYCYVFDRKMKKSWTKAESYCQATYKGHLVKVPDTATQMFIRQLTDKCRVCETRGIWIGGTDYNNPAKWLWSADNTTVKLPATILELEDDNERRKVDRDDSPKKSCMVLRKDDTRWAAWRCQHRLHFVCQYQAGATTAAAATNSFWVGLQKAVSGYQWNLGPNCTTVDTTSLPTSATGESITNLAYTYDNTAMTLNAQPQNAMAAGLICRKDFNICGRNLCPSCGSCIPQPNYNCFACA